MDSISHKYRQMKDFMYSTETKHLLNYHIYEISEFIDSFLGLNEESNIKILQAAILAIHDIHNRLNKKNSQGILLTHFYKDSKAVELYTKLLDSTVNNADNLKLQKICEHFLANKAKRIINIFTSFQDNFSDAAIKLMDEIIKKGKNNPYNFAMVENIYGIRKILDDVIDNLKTYNFSETNKKFDDQDDDIITITQQMKIYLNLPIITKDDIECFLSKLSTIILHLHTDFNKCIESLNCTLHLKSEFFKNSIKILRSDVDKTVVIGKNLISFFNTLIHLINPDEETIKIEFGYMIDINENGDEKKLLLINQTLRNIKKP